MDRDLTLMHQSSASRFSKRSASPPLQVSSPTNVGAGTNRAPFFSPFHLLRADLFTHENAASASFDASISSLHNSSITGGGIHASSDERCIYKRVAQFIEILLANYAVTTIRPAPAQIVSLRELINAYIRFLLAPTLDGELERFKIRLRANRQFVDVMNGYFKHVLTTQAVCEKQCFYK